MTHKFLYFFKYFIYVLIVFFFFIILYNVCFLHEVFVMEPNIIVDFYGNKEYISSHPYVYYNFNINETAHTIPSDENAIYESFYGRPGPCKPDWYATHNPAMSSGKVIIQKTFCAKPGMYEPDWYATHKLHYTS